MKSDLLALGAILLWSLLAALGVHLAHVPPFLLTGIGLLVGSLIALPLSGLRWRDWKVSASTLALGIYGLFGFHLLLFLALRLAPPVPANLVNYLWPLGMVVLAPLILPGTPLRVGHVGAALLGFSGAALAILGRATPVSHEALAGALADAGVALAEVGRQATSPAHTEPDAPLAGYALALASAFIWATYSLGTRRVAPFRTAAVGTFAAVSGGLAMVCHVLLEPSTTLTLADWGALVLLGLGPLGGAFFLWDAALKCGDPRRIGMLAFLTPLLSTVVLSLSTATPLTGHTAVAAILVVVAAVWATRVSAKG